MLPTTLANWNTGLADGVLSRRDWLRLGGFGCFGLSLAGLLQAASARAAPSNSARPPLRSCILVFFYGGPSHHDTWDMKPDAPAEVRGEFQPIATTVPGLAVCEHLPRCAQVMHHLALVRSVHHPMRNHNSAAVEALCGRTPLGGDLELLADDALSFPCYGSALGYMERHQQRGLAHVALPHVMYNIVQLPGQTAGFLGAAFNPFQIDADPSAADFRVDVLELRERIGPQRLEQREALLAELDHRVTSAARSGDDRLSAYYQRAFNLLRSDALRKALDLQREDPRVREAYGQNKLGQSLLLARRLVESGVRFVTVYDKIHNGQEANWDSHESVFPRLKDHLLPPADRGLAALVSDLDARGLLDSTLVVALGEFGRTPRINGAAGRDHWPDCFTVVLAGGGVRGGSVHGSSDKLGAYPQTDPVTTGDLAATLFWRFGLDPAAEIHDPTGRPFRLAEGRPLERLFSS